MLQLRLNQILYETSSKRGKCGGEKMRGFVRSTIYHVHMSQTFLTLYQLKRKELLASFPNLSCDRPSFRLYELISNNFLLTHYYIHLSMQHLRESEIGPPWRTSDHPLYRE